MSKKKRDYRKSVSSLPVQDKINLVKHIADSFISGTGKEKASDVMSPGRSAFGNAYRGARSDKYNSDWLVSSETADQELLWNNLPTLRYRSRQLSKDNPIAEGTIIALQQMIVGEGPVCRCSITDNDVLRDQVQAIIDESINGCDVTGEKSITQICNNIVGAECDDGDVLVTLPLDASRPVEGVQTVVDIIEADRILTPSGMKNDSVRHGVQYSLSGKISGYWVRKLGLSEQEHKYGYSVNIAQDNFKFFEREKAGRISSWLMKRPVGIERPGQSRQVPIFSSCIGLLKDMEDLLDVTIVGMRAAACIMGVIKSDNPEEIYEGLSTDASDSKELTDKYGYRYSKMQPGTMLPLRTGESIDLLDPKRNGAEVEPILLRLCKFLAMKVRIPYPVLFLDLSEINYSSYRGGILEARKMLKGWRSHLENDFVMRYLATRIKEAWLKGLIPAAKELTPQILNVRVDWPAWGYIDAVKETNAALKGIAGDLSSPQREAAERNEDAFQIIEEKAKFYAEKKKIYSKHGVSEFMAVGDADGAKTVDLEKGSLND